MSHDPERDAAAYVTGVMRARRARRFEEHLLECEDCWREVTDGRLGRSVAESIRDLAPQDLRERIRATVAAATPSRRGRARPAFAWALVSVVLAGGALGAITLRTPAQPAAITAAVTDFTGGRMVVDAPATTAAPDLAGTPFELAYTGAGWLHDQPVDAFMFMDDAGHRLLVYQSASPFPVAAGARLSAPSSAWRATIDGVALLCTSEPHAMLAVADDDAALDELARAIGLSA